MSRRHIHSWNYPVEDSFDHCQCLCCGAKFFLLQSFISPQIRWWHLFHLGMCFPIAVLVSSMFLEGRRVWGSLLIVWLVTMLKYFLNIKYLKRNYCVIDFRVQRWLINNDNVIVVECCQTKTQSALNFQEQCNSAFWRGCDVRTLFDYRCLVGFERELLWNDVWAHTWPFFASLHL